MATGNTDIKGKSFFRTAWRWTKRIFLWLFVLQFVYIILLRWVNPPLTMTQLVSWVSGHGLKRDYVDFSEISTNARLAVIASEDQLFPDHSGFDWKSIKKAQKYNERKPGRTHGASTISQQVAKNVFLWQGRSWFRKGIEVYFTFMIETFWSKQRILDVYLNVIEMGDGIFGIEAAAQAYFNKPAKGLSRREAALIASCLPNPKIFKVKAPSADMLNKVAFIQRQMSNIETDPDIQDVIGTSPPKK